MHLFSDHPISELKSRDFELKIHPNLTLIGRHQHLIVVECSVCKKDPDLFGKGLFCISASHLNRGRLPCGCSKIPKWNEDQYRVKVDRILSTSIYKIGASKSFAGDKTEYEILCPYHGSRYLAIRYILNKGYSCPTCSPRIAKQKDDKDMIASFMASGSFVEDTKFSRSSRKTSQGAKNYWKVFCPSCDSSYESTSSDLKRGCRGCQCCKNFNKAYLNIIYDGDLAVALKFGITTNIKERIYRQNLKSSFAVKNLYSWSFTSKYDCMKAEQEVKRTISCGVLNKTEFLDGWTETCYIKDFDKIVSIFSSYGTKIN